ncbi:MAG TPA: amidohydrolase family protein [Candidatus Dormibacteraeota bacterium]|nr:amidohydrolase family protein [Candidatus Dormibacteraeota bacterium]
MIDSHGHPITGAGEALDLSGITLEIVADQSARELRAKSAPTRLSQELMAVRLSAYFGCAVEELGVARAQVSSDWSGYVSGLFSDAKIEGVVLDPGTYEEDPSATAEAMTKVANCQVRSIMRLDPLLDRMIADGGTASEIVSAAEVAVRQAPERGYVGLKTILAYRTGLNVSPEATLKEADSSLRSTKDLPTRRRGKALRDLICRRTLGWAAELNMPIQFHTGFGDSELRLSEANPLALEELLLTSEGTAATVVLIHGSYPWHEELAYLALVRPNVHAEISLFNLFAPATIASRLERVLELAPSSKVLCGTDGHGSPESYWFAAQALRQAWRTLRQRWAAEGARESWLSAVEGAIFHTNTAHLYGF